MDKNRVYEKQLKELYEHWNRVYLYGNEEDLDMADGYYLNRIREDILRVRYEMEANLSADLYPEEYYLQVPDEVPAVYMARRQAIRDETENVLSMVLHMQSWHWVVEHEHLMSEKVKKRAGYYRIAACLSRMQEALEREDIVAMRRLLSLEELTGQISHCRICFQSELSKAGQKSQVDETCRKKEKLQGQMTIFDFAA